MKLKVNPWRLVWRFLLVLLIVDAAIFTFSLSMFFDITFSPLTFVPVKWTFKQPLFLSIMFGLSLVAFIPSLFAFYYTIENKYFTMKKYGKEYTFEYSNIEFVDFAESERKNMIIFYSKTAKMRYLIGDRDRKVLEALKKNCKNLLTVEEFRRKHPEERY